MTFKCFICDTTGKDKDHYVVIIEKAPGVRATVYAHFDCFRKMVVGGSERYNEKGT